MEQAGLKDKRNYENIEDYLDSTPTKSSSVYVDLATLIEEPLDSQYNVEPDITSICENEQNDEDSAEIENSLTDVMLEDDRKSEGHRWWIIPAGVIAATSAFMIFVGFLPLSVTIEAVVLCGGLATICAVGGITCAVAHYC